MKSKLQGALALALYICLMFTTLASIGCDKSKLFKQPSRATLEELAHGGQVAANVLTANETVPDQLLTTGVIKQELHDQLVTGISEAEGDAKDFNDGMTKVLQSEKPDLKPLLPVALRMVKRIHALNHSEIPGWNAVFSLAEVGISVIANYFALKVSELRHAGLTDKQIFAVAGVTYDEELLQLIESYAPQTSSTNSE
jgi:hypothetical protein